VQPAEFTDADAGGIEKRDLGLMLWIMDGTDNRADLFPGGNGGKILVKAKERDFSFVPVLVKDIVEKIPELGDMDINSAGIQPFHIPEPADISADLLPGNGGKLPSRELIFGPADEDGQIRYVSGNSVVRKITEGKNISMFCKISSVRFKHGVSPP
jgi:hypothetical protein